MRERHRQVVSRVADQIPRNRAFRKIGKGHKEKPCAMSNPNPPNKFKKGEPRPAGAGRRPGAVNHLTTARVKTERKVRVV